MVTKQQQLEWLARCIHVWAGNRTSAYLMSADKIGFIVGMDTLITPKDLLIGSHHLITKQEWQQERDKMQKQADQAVHPAAQDNSWHERGELPHVGCECNYVTGISCVQVKIQGVGRVDGYPVAFFVMKDSWCTATAEFFRPLRTEREKAIDEMISVISSMDFLSVKSIAENLYGAGCRMEKPQ